MVAREGVVEPGFDANAAASAAFPVVKARGARLTSSTAGIVVLVGCLVFLAPLIVMILTALQPENDVISRIPASFPVSWGGDVE